MAIEHTHLATLGTQQVIFVHTETDLAGMGAAIHSATEELTRALKAQEIAPAGPWFTHHHRRPTDTFDFDVCFPVTAMPEVSGRLQTATLPALQVARTTYRGPYGSLPHAWPEFLGWVEQQGLARRGDFFEVYVTGPRDTPDPNQWQTDLIIPLEQGEAKEERNA